MSDNAIATWAYVDGQSVTGTIRVGVVAYHRAGVDYVRYNVDGGTNTDVSAETINTDTGEYEYVYTIDTSLLTDGSRTVNATAVPNTGTSTVLPGRTIFVDDPASPTTYYVATTGDDGTGDGSSGSPWLTIDYALGQVASGDTILVGAGTYTPPGTSRTFTRFTTVKPNGAVTVTLDFSSASYSPSYQYVKLEDLDIDATATDKDNKWGFNFGGHHLWITGGTHTGSSNPGTPTPQYDDSLVRFGASFTGHGTLENVSCDYAGNCFLSSNAAADHLICRGNTARYLWADFAGYESSYVLISGNENLENHATQTSEPRNHCDFVACNQMNHDNDIEHVIIRNNKHYDGYDQGLKFGGDLVVRATTGLFRHIAVVNNVLRAHATVVGQYIKNENSDYYTYDNFLIEHNTVWVDSAAPGRPILIRAAADSDLTDFYIRNNIFAGRASSLPTQTGLYHTYNIIEGGLVFGTLGTGETNTDPLLADPTGNDLSIGSSSPAVDAATSGAGIAYDVDWNSRASDLGAYEDQPKATDPITRIGVYGLVGGVRAIGSKAPEPKATDPITRIGVYGIVGGVRTIAAKTGAVAVVEIVSSGWSALGATATITGGVVVDFVSSDWTALDASASLSVTAGTVELIVADWTAFGAAAAISATAATAELASADWSALDATAIPSVAADVEFIATDWTALDAGASSATFRGGVETYPIPAGGRNFLIPAGGRNFQMN